MTVPEDGTAAHAERVSRLVAEFRALPPEAPVRLAKKTSNLFRARAATGAPGLDVSGFTNVLSVDPVARRAQVEGMVTYEKLVDATLPYGLMPLVVPQLKTITLGGAVTGMGIESSSFRNGTPHESVCEMEILTGDGRVVVARPDSADRPGEHSDLFFGFPNSYGTLGYALRLEIELEPVKPFVRLEHRRFGSPKELFAELEAVCADPAVDFVDGTVFSRDELYLTVGTFVDDAPYLSDYTYTHIYYRSIRRYREDHLTARDYLWRWDTDWFWCSRAFGVQKPLVRRLLGRKRLRSDVYWKIVAFERKWRLNARLERMRGLPPREDVVQDVEVGIERAEEFCDFFLREIPISPFWICPLKQRDPDAVWPLYTFDPGRLYVNFGFWSTVPLAPGQSDGDHNRLIEGMVGFLGGRKSLYSTSFYPPEEFWRLYNGPAYELVKKAYDPEGRLLDLYAKCVQRR